MRDARPVLVIASFSTLLGGCAFASVLRAPEPMEATEVHARATDEAAGHHRAAMDAHDAAVRLHEAMARPVAPPPPADPPADR